MKLNHPVTQREHDYDPNITLVSTTDRKGLITFVNEGFVAVSGFTPEELIGASHNIVRHPDMPPAAFKDLWDTVASGKAWRGMVKNRRKDGDHYWVDAYVTPVYQGAELVGYQSVRCKPTAKQVHAAERLYRRVNERKLQQLPRALSLEWGYGFRVVALGLITGMLGLGAGITGAPVAGGLALAVGLGGGVVLARSFRSPVKRIVEAAKRIAAGDLGFAIEVRDNTELSEALQATKMVQARMATIIGHIKSSAAGVAAASEQLNSAIHSAGRNVQTQHNEIDQVATAMNEMSATVHEVAQNTSLAAGSAVAAHDNAEQGKAVVDRTVANIQALAGDVKRAAESINQLEQESNDITTILDVIREIADQTNLLALNAAIEAARAGDQGRGFAVVADEVRQLAQRTQQSTQEIHGLIERLQQGAKSAVAEMASSRSRAEECAEDAGNAGTVLVQITTAVNSINDMNTQIATAAEEQSAVVEEMNRNVSNINALSAGTLDNIGEVMSNAEHLAQMARQLDDLVRQYRT